MTAKFLGIDTSNYTTSIAVTDLSGKVHFDKRILLNVKPGEIGLRQSDAFYQHVMNLPGIFFDIEQSLISEIAMIAVSEKPRQVVGSYMPVFNAGVQFAKVISKSLNQPIHRVSHQDGHIMADLDLYDHSRNELSLNLHISGGTTEIFTSLWNEKEGYFSTEVMGGTLDLSIGQLIDRIGVYMGYEFPSGSAMSQDVSHWLAEHYAKPIPLGLKHESGKFNLSGIENKVKKLIDSQEYTKAHISYSLFIALGKLLADVLQTLLVFGDTKRVIIAGGVMSNPWMREAIKNQVKGVPLHFTAPQLCTDNAVGVSKLAAIKYLSMTRSL